MLRDEVQQPDSLGPRAWSMLPDPAWCVAPVLVPADRDVAAMLWRQVEDRYRTILEAESAPIFESELWAQAPDLLRKMLAAHELGGASESAAGDAVESLAERGEVFGGYLWADAFRGSWLDVAHATAVRRRLLARGVRPTEHGALGAHADAILAWCTAFPAAAMLVSGESATIPEVRARLLLIVSESARRAYAIVREIELAAAPTLNGLPWRATELSREEMVLEADAESESRELLRKAERA